jgi:hypothetical protein
VVVGQQISDQLRGGVGVAGVAGVTPVAVMTSLSGSMATWPL